MTSSVWVFFYGGLINPTMLDKVGMKPKRQEPATLSGFDIRISPYVNLVRSAGHTVFGMLIKVTHGELEHTYSQLKARYLPEAVIVADSSRTTCARRSVTSCRTCRRDRRRSIMLRRWRRPRRVSDSPGGTCPGSAASCQPVQRRGEVHGGLGAWTCESKAA